MSDELVKRLRSMHWCVTTEVNGVGASDRKVALAAADRIEQLTAEREALEQDNHRWKMECENFWRDREKALTAERDQLQKAITDAGPYLERGLDKMAFNIIRAALKGETP